MPEINLKNLLADIVTVAPDFDRSVSGINSDSRTIKPGELFVAAVGEQFDGRKYINEAVSRGAIAVIAEADENYPDPFFKSDTTEKPVPVFPINQLQKQVGRIAARFYADPSAQMKIVGVTGTNGKTSCTQFIARCLEMAKQKCGVIGTLGSGFPDYLKMVGLTTPDAITLQKELAEFAAQNAKAVAMEVSSHSLAQNRVEGIHFNIAVFTNLTRDHLDYHGNMLNYAKAKAMLFQKPGLQYAVINLDDEYGRQFLQQIPANVKAYGYTLQNQTADIPLISAENLTLTDHGFTANVKTPWGEGKLESSLLGRFNVSNLLAVLTTLNLLSIPFADALNYLGKLTTVTGRMQMLGGGKSPTVVVDYAHTPDALEKALKALREHCQGKLYCIFGCGGERDRGKRPLMAETAERWSDQVIVTDDNPRREYSQKIIEDIMAGFLYPHKVTIIPDRRQAIAQTIKMAQPGDVILVAGKGHENYQIIGEERLLFSDAEEVQKALNG